MAANGGDQKEAKFKGVLKEDVDLKWAKLTVRVNNLKKSRDHVAVEYPSDSNSWLIVRVNGAEYYNRRLPAAILTNKSKHEVSFGEKGKITVKLRKAQPGNWVNRWSPRRELLGPTGTSDVAAQPAINGTSVTEVSSSPPLGGYEDSSVGIVTMPDSDTDDN